ncbi:MAG: TIGR01212 family radical SAM protein [Bacteroidales bacterium]|nr:TIGR01212 family radical SAM protein [Bacteroidales bacterium]
MATDIPFYDFSEYLKAKFPDFKVQKISVNAGFTCPNRDGSKGRGGCIYCNNSSFTPGYCDQYSSIANQLEEGKGFFARKYPQMRYLAYFQSYTNSYAETEVAIARYSEALSQPMVEGLIIATRPDCMPDEILEYLQQVSKEKFIFIEYGAESCNNAVLERVNRCHTWQDTVDTVLRTHKYGLDCGLHLILGLPTEDRESMMQSAKEVSKLPIKSLKLHQLQIIRATRLAKEYEVNPEIVHLYDIEEYISVVSDFIERLRPDIALDRFVSQCPPEFLIAPRWGLKNYEFTAKLIKSMQQRGVYQGSLYEK